MPPSSPIREYFRSEAQYARLLENMPYAYDCFNNFRQDLLVHRIWMLVGGILSIQLIRPIMSASRADYRDTACAPIHQPLSLPLCPSVVFQLSRTMNNEDVILIGMECKNCASTVCFCYTNFVQGRGIQLCRRHLHNLSQIKRAHQINRLKPKQQPASKVTHSTTTYAPDTAIRLSLWSFSIG